MSEEETIEIEEEVDSGSVGLSEAEVDGDEMDDGGESLGERLHRLREYSGDSGTVEGHVVNIDEGEQSVTFEVEHMATGETVQETLAIPDPWRESSKLAAILDKYGYEPSTIEMMEGERVELVKQFGQWRLANPLSGRAVRGLYRLAMAGGAIFFGSFFAPTVLMALFGDVLFPLLAVSILLGPFAVVYFGGLLALRYVV